MNEWKIFCGGVAVGVWLAIVIVAIAEKLLARK